MQEDVGSSQMGSKNGERELIRNPTEKEVKGGKEENVAQVHMVRSEKQERSDIVYIHIYRT